MRKTHILGLTLFAVLAVSAISAASALADSTHLWLVGGTAVTTTLSIASTGELELSDLKAIAGLAATVLCSGILDGTVGATGADTITEVLTLTGGATSTTPLSGTPLLCTNISNCGTPEVWALNLPWKTQLELSGSTWIDDITTTNGDLLVGWEVLCKATGIADDCEIALAQPTIENMVGEGVLATFAEENAGECELSKALTGDVHGSGLITSSEGALSVSEAP